MPSMDNGIPQHFIDDLVARIDIVDLIDTRVPLKKAGKNYVACCPFHEERTPSFTVSPDKQFYHCFGCGAHGTAIGFLMNHERLGFVEAIEDLAQSVGLTVPRATRNPKVVAINESLTELMDKAGAFYQQQLRNHPQAQLAVNYLKQRGLSGSIAKDYGIGFSPPGWNNLLNHLGSNHATSLVTAGLAIKSDQGKIYDRFRNRIMFPIRNRRGQIIGFGGRVLENDLTTQDNKEATHKEPKYLNSPETPLFHKGRELYGLYECRQAHPKISQLVVVEGYMDVVALAQFGIRYAVATLGTAATENHIELLFRASNRVIFCFDGDTAGKQAAWRALENTLPAIRGERQARFLFLPEGEDPDYFLHHLGEDIDTSHIDGRTLLIEKARPYLEKIKSELYRELISEQVAKMAHTDSRRVFKLDPKATPAHQKSPFELTVKRSNIRWAIALLLQYPELATHIQDIDADDITLPGSQILIDLLHYLKTSPEAKCGTILEHFRHAEYANHLEKLALWESTDIHAESAPEKEFQDVIQRLRQQSYKHQLNHLLEKSENTGLSEAEMQQLSALMRRLKG